MVVEVVAAAASPFLARRTVFLALSVGFRRFFVAFWPFSIASRHRWSVASIKAISLLSATLNCQMNVITYRRLFDLLSAEAVEASLTAASLPFPGLDAFLRA